MKSPIISRRGLIQTGLLGLGGLALPLNALSQSNASIVIVGGGFGGASAGRTLKDLLPSAEITLIEANANYTACPFSNLVIATERPLSAQEFSYDRLQAAGISIISARATSVDASGQIVELQDGSQVPYDRLILSPGVDMRWGALEGYSQEAAERHPHAWKAGAQTQLLRDQLVALEDGENVVMTVPPAPYRCPPGPYERASMIAHYLKTNRPRSKLIILDAKDSFSKMALFQEAWAEHYPDHLEWRGALDDGAVSRVDANLKTVYTDFDELSAAVINVIPPQKAGQIADAAGVSDQTGWCPIDPLSFESKLQPKVHVIGDATIAAPMPKSAFSANLQAKVCAFAVARLLSDLEPIATTLANTCYSYTTPDEAISIAGVYSNVGGQLSSVSGAGGVSPLNGDKAVRQAEAAQAAHWFQTITNEAFG
ncbi:MAG: FAD-dependent oxidoreductase [Henriciella sp.]|nr:FAD-dependent oxidoreductase [Henriciella sp.]